MTSLDREENQLCDSHLTEYVSKNMELKVIKCILSATYDILQRKKTVLKDEYKKLGDINYSVLDIEDQFCSKIWNFSLAHNFNNIFIHYPNVTMTLHPYNSKNKVLAELENEINIVRNEITHICKKDSEQDIKNAALVLKDLKSFSEEILDLIRLINTPKNSKNICNIPTCYQPCINEGFMNARKMIKKTNVCSDVLIERKVTNKVSKKCCNTNNNIKLGKFVMKKRSLISLKFEQDSRN
ncbi:uncharacterized protein LOC128889881 [Hylaeus anthracinus]|uniref:uncharacterized protein LOC128889881 n=1 Tax=Hylaeus anthracinus TaxID=313031 RepID=UPI0023BA24EA|nr:uncharacterized protein LOC128889881 [Hylaeus anthracinus]